jgi:hypothetical protein
MRNFLKTSLFLLATLSLTQAMEGRSESSHKSLLHFENATACGVRLHISACGQNEKDNTLYQEQANPELPSVRKHSRYNFTTADLSSKFKDVQGSPTYSRLLTTIHILMPGVIEEKMIKWDTSLQSNNVKLIYNVFNGEYQLIDN